MAKKRHQDHKGLPQGWRWKDGAYRYRVPKGKEAQWDNKTEFRLGKSQSEAYRTYAGRVASMDGAIQTFAQLFDRYVVDVTPNKALTTQKNERHVIQKLREMIGDNPLIGFKSKHAYELRDHIVSTADNSSKKGGAFSKKKSKKNNPNKNKINKSKKILIL